MKTLNLNHLTQEIEPIIAAKGYELVDLAWLRQQGRWTFRIVIDRLPGKGFINHDDCGIVSHELSTWLDVKDILPGNYDLEVSSPGIPRSLKKQKDFLRFIGGKVKIRLQMGLVEKSGQRTFTGTLLEASEKIITLCPENEKTPIELVIAEIEKAVLLEHPPLYQQLEQTDAK